MVIERKFIERGKRDLKVQEWLASQLDRSDFSYIEIRRTPLNTRVIIHAGRPGIIIGRAGTKIRELTDILAEKFKLENPLLEVKAIEKPELDATIIARQIAAALERGMAYRKLANIYLQKVMEAGAIGVEIVVSGKLSGERSRSGRFSAGYIRKCGEPAQKYVDRAHAEAVLKAGVLGVKVAIMKTLPVEMLAEREIIEAPGPEVKELRVSEERAEEAKEKVEEVEEKEEKVEKAPKEKKVKKVKKKEKKKAKPRISEEKKAKKRVKTAKKEVKKKKK